MGQLIEIDRNLVTASNGRLLVTGFVIGRFGSDSRLLKCPNGRAWYIYAQDEEQAAAEVLKDINHELRELIEDHGPAY